MNGVPSVCTNGVCSAKDGTDLCAMFGNPCGAPTPSTTTPAPYQSPLNCYKPCYLKSALDGIRGQVTTNVLSVTGHFIISGLQLWQVAIRKVLMHADGPIS